MAKKQSKINPVSFGLQDQPDDDLAQTAPGQTDSRCPLVNNKCIKQYCDFWDRKLQVCSIKFASVVLDEIMIRLGNIENELDALRD